MIQSIQGEIEIIGKYLVYCHMYVHLFKCTPICMFNGLNVALSCVCSLAKIYTCLLYAHWLICSSASCMLIGLYVHLPQVLSLV